MTLQFLEEKGLELEFLVILGQVLIMHGGRCLAFQIVWFWPLECPNSVLHGKFPIGPPQLQVGVGVPFPSRSSQVHGLSQLTSNQHFGTFPSRHQGRCTLEELSHANMAGSCLGAPLVAEIADLFTTWKPSDPTMLSTVPVAGMAAIGPM